MCEYQSTLIVDADYFVVWPCLFEVRTKFGSAGSREKTGTRDHMTREVLIWLHPTTTWSVIIPQGHLLPN